MKSLNELVTVNRKYAFGNHYIKSKYVRRKRHVMICESGNLPGVRCAPDTAYASKDYEKFRYQLVVYLCMLVFRTQAFLFSEEKILMDDTLFMGEL